MHCTEDEKRVLSEYMMGNSKYKIIFLQGGVGVGKTHIGLLLLRFYPCANNWRRFVTSPQMLAMCRESQARFFDTYGQCECLMIDDIGAECAAEWESKHYFELFDYRFGMNLPTIITSNLGKEKIAELLGERIVSRMSGIELCLENTIDFRSSYSALEQLAFSHRSFKDAKDSV